MITELNFSGLLRLAIHADLSNLTVAYIGWGTLWRLRQSSDD